MKRSLLIATGLVLLSTSAFATTSRMTSLGESDSRGSHFIDDTRNVFRNAAHAGTTTNYIVGEWGTAGGNAPSGGIFREAGSFNYGVFLNDQSDSQDAIAQGTSTYGSGGANGTAGYADRSDNLDLFFAGDMGFQWGARVGYTTSETKAATAGAIAQSHDGMSLGLGVIFGDLEASINYVLKDEYENKAAAAVASGKAEGDNMDLNVGYNYGAWKFFGTYAKKAMEFTSTGTTAAEEEKTTITLGAGHTHEVSSTARIYSSINYISAKETNKQFAATLEGEDKTSDLKATVAFEADATSWLTWRGSFSQSVIIDSATAKAATAGALESESDGSTTTFAAGATLNFGKLKVDGDIGTTQGVSALNSNLSTDVLFANVGVHYWF